MRFEASLPAAAALLRERFSATRVIAFGSVISGDLSGQIDVDLAVDGLPGKYQFEAQAALMALFSAPVDLVMLEQAPEFLRERIEAEGRRL